MSSSSLHEYRFLLLSPPLSFFHSRFSSNSSTHRFHGYRSAMYLLFRYVFVCVCARASRRIRHTEDTRIQAEQIKRRLPGIIRSVARRGARTNQAASLFPAPELAFLFFSPSFFLSFLFFLRSPFLFLFSLFFSFFFPTSPLVLAIPRRLARTARGTLCQP